MEKDFKKIAEKWQKKWAAHKVFETKIEKVKKKYYVLEMFPYPSGKLHMGHVRNYSLGDAIARYKRMQGHNVLYPMGYDSFGLPAENAAIKGGVHPKEWTEARIKEMKAQSKQLGMSYDWGREIATFKSEYYRWNQWIFLQMLKKGLAYRKEGEVNWCEKCGTVLANEQVQNGKCWRCGEEAVKKKLEQWFLKITDYADELLEDLEKLVEWPEKVKVMQKNWIGKSHGLEVKFKIKDSKKEFNIFTTRPDTIFGITFMVFAPEHPLVQELVEGTEYEEEVKKFAEYVKKKSAIERTAEDKPKEGMFIGKFAINPVNGEEVPIFVADFVLMDYGTGAIMAVPSHDQRDFEFAEKYSIQKKVVIQPKGKELDPHTMEKAFVEEGVLVNSGEFNGLPNKEAIEKISDWIEKKGIGKRTVNFKLKDWLVSRQRYWGTPIPVVYCKKCGIQPVPEKELPVELPVNVKFTGAGNPLAGNEKFLKAKCPACKGPARRETDTMDTFFDSSWYFLRYVSPKEKRKPFVPKDVNNWLPVDQYIGGIEHAVMHLLYARFFTKVLRDLKLLNFDEPFKRLMTQGMVLKDGRKMSKSFGNVVDPGEIISKYGPDTARWFILFTALPESELDWSDSGVEASYKFLNKIARLVEESKKEKLIAKGKVDSVKKQENKFLLSNIHALIEKVTGNIERFYFSIALSDILGFVNELYSFKQGIDKKDAEAKKVFGFALNNLILLIAPFVPHLAEELWAELGNKGFVSQQPWPKAEKKFIDKKLVAAQQIVAQIKEDVENIKQIAGIKNPKKAKIIVAPKWKWIALEKLRGLEKPDFGAAMKLLMQEKELKQFGKEIQPFLKSIIRRLPELKELEKVDELKMLKESEKMLSKEIGAAIEIESAEKSQDPKAKNAFPGKPAIVLE